MVQTKIVLSDPSSIRGALVFSEKAAMSLNVAERPAWFDRSPRIRLDVSGPDRAKFLHNLTTNDVKRLAVGAGQESFVTNPQGKTLAYMTLLATDRAILLRTDPGVADSFVPHLRKYGVFDDVAIVDVSLRTFEYHLIGPGLAAIVTGLGFDPTALDKLLHHAEVVVDGHPVRLIRESLVGEPGWTFVGPLEASRAILDRIGSSGAVEGAEATFEALRIEAGTPVSGRDVQTNNLPQEVGRDARAINFVKGCYLGQETVARLDALGHVNRILKGGWVEGTKDVPPVGSSLVGEDGKTVGSITSAAFSERLDAPVFLGYVRVAQAIPGARLTISGNAEGVIRAVITDFPIAR